MLLSILSCGAAVWFYSLWPAVEARGGGVAARCFLQLSAGGPVFSCIDERITRRPGLPTRSLAVRAVLSVAKMAIFATSSAEALL
jgi:hypothetical protein